MAALWTEICPTHPALSAIADDYEVFCVVDASGGSSTVAHDLGVQRMIQSGGTFERDATGAPTGRLRGVPAFNAILQQMGHPPSTNILPRRA